MKFLGPVSRGSLAGITAQGSRTGQVMRPRCRPRRQGNANQLEARATFGQVARVWRLLTDQERSTWSTASLGVVSGFNLFQRQATVALSAGQEIETTPQFDVYPDPESSLSYLQADNILLVANFGLDNPAGVSWVVQVARPRYTPGQFSRTGSPWLPFRPKDWVTAFVSPPGGAPQWTVATTDTIPYGSFDSHFLYPVRTRYVKRGVPSPWRYPDVWVYYDF